MKPHALYMMVGLAVGSLWVLVGCTEGAGGRAEILRTDIQPIRENGVLQAMTVISEIKVRGTGETRQIRYVVALVDHNGQPIRSTDGRYEIGDGRQVAAARTAMMPSGSHTQTMRVSIPADQLELRSEHLPASADVQIYRGKDGLLTRQRYELPFVGEVAG